MTHLLPEFRRSLPEGLQLDGELVALADDGRPDLHRLSSRMLHGRTGIAVTLFVFDALAVEGLATTMLPYSERRAILEELDIENQRVRLVATFEDDQRLIPPRCCSLRSPWQSLANAARTRARRRPDVVPARLTFPVKSGNLFSCG